LSCEKSRKADKYTTSLKLQTHSTMESVRFAHFHKTITGG